MCNCGFLLSIRGIYIVMNVTLKGPGLPILPTLALKHKLEEAVALSFSADLGTPVAIFEKLASEQQYAFLFEATEGD